jgi:membrane protease YdiL (CAAX protease family)
VISAREVVAYLLGALFLLLFSGALAVLLRPLLRTGRLLPPQRHRAVPWTGLEVCFALVAPQILGWLTAVVLVQSGFLDELYGTDFQSLKSGVSEDALRQVDADRLNLWTSAVLFPLQVGATLLFFRLVSKTRPYHLGLTSQHPGRDAGSGLVVWAVATPLVFAINLVVSLAYALLVRGEPEDHPLTRVVSESAPAVDWVMMAFLAVIAAPISEELVFRGILQKWFGRRPWGGDAAMLAALALALLFRSAGLEAAVRQGDPSILLYELSPVLFVLALVPGYLAVDRFAPLLFPQPRRTEPPAPPPPPPVPIDRITVLPARPPPPAVPSDRITTLPGPPLPELPSLLDRYQIRVRLPYGPTPHNTARAIYGTAALFAMFHVSAWPSPVPLFVLALGLGWLAYRTQSLIGPMVLHGLFNSVTVVVLVIQLFTDQLPPPKPAIGKPTTSAGRRAPPGSTCTRVPGWSLPRRTYANATAVPNRGDTTDEVTCPTSLPSRKSLAPCGTASVPAIFRPVRDRLMWPRSRMRTKGSWPRKQPLV